MAAAAAPAAARVPAAGGQRGFLGQREPCGPFTTIHPQAALPAFANTNLPSFLPQHSPHCWEGRGPCQGPVVGAGFGEPPGAASVLQPNAGAAEPPAPPAAPRRDGRSSRVIPHTNSQHHWYREEPLPPPCTATKQLIKCLLAQAPLAVLPARDAGQGMSDELPPPAREDHLNSPCFTQSPPQKPPLC